MIHSYTDFLGFLMFVRVMDSKTMTILCGSDDRATYYRKKALDNGHIKKISVKRRQGLVRTETIFNLTKAGLHYFIDHDKNISTYFFMGEAKKYLSVLSGPERQVDKKLRLAQTTSTLVIANLAGATVPAENFSTSNDDDEPVMEEDDEASTEKTPVMEYIGEDLSDEDVQSIRLFQNDLTEENNLIYHTAAVIKAVAGGSNKAVKTKDYNAGRYSGVIDSRFKSVFLFDSPMFGLGWHKWINSREKSAYMLWCKGKAIAEAEQRQRAGDCAALIVDNPTQFRKLYFREGEERQEKKEMFGGWFDHFYIIPKAKQGIDHLRWLMLNDDSEVNKSILNDAIESGEYTRYTAEGSRFYPLLNEENKPTALGFQLDAKHMLVLEGIAKQHPDILYAVLCYEWQEEYYKEIMPDNVEIISLPMA